MLKYWRRRDRRQGDWGQVVGRKGRMGLERWCCLGTVELGLWLR